MNQDAVLKDFREASEYTFPKDYSKRRFGDRESYWFSLVGNYNYWYPVFKEGAVVDLVDHGGYSWYKYLGSGQRRKLETLHK